MNSPQFQRFLDGYFTEMVVRDGPDVESLHLLDDKDRAKAEDMLVSAIRKDHFRWYIHALGELQSQRAIPLLLQLARGRSASARIFASHALYRINGFSEAALLITGILNKAHILPRSALDRHDAATLLRDIPSELSIAALYQACKDRDFSVSSAALESLCILLGMPSPDGEVVRTSNGKVRCKTSEDTMIEIEAALAARGHKPPEEVP